MKSKKIVVLFCVFILTLLSGCSANSQKVTLGGVSISIPYGFMEDTLIVSSIDQIENLDKRKTVCINTDSAYMLFNQNALIILGQKGTNFNFTKDKTTYDDMDYASFTLLDSVKKDGSFKKAPVSAQINLSKEIYGDFNGTLIVNDSNEQTSFFVGTLSGLNMTMARKRVIRNIISSICLDENEYEPIAYENGVVVKEEIKKELSKDDFNDITGFDINKTPITLGVKVDKVYKRLPSNIKIKKDPSPGTHYEAIKYKARNSPLDEFFYINVFITGENEEPLCFRGVTYPKRTYDYIDGDYFVYYEVPNGIDSYFLSFYPQITKGAVPYIYKVK